VAGGDGDAETLDLLLGCSEVKVIVVSCPRPDHPAADKAGALGIAIVSDPAAVASHPVDLVLEGTGHPGVVEALRQALPPGVEVVPVGVLRFFRSLVRGYSQRAASLAQHLTTLGMLSRTLLGASAPAEVFREIARAAVLLLGARMARVWVDDPAEGALKSQGGFGLDPEAETLLTAIPTLAHGAGVVGAVFASRRPEYVPDVQEDARWANPEPVRQAGLHAYAGLPLVAGERAVGVLSILFGERRSFTSEEQELMELLAGQAAVAIENARLLEEAERRRRAAERLTETGRLITQTLDHEERGRCVAESLRKLLGVRYSALFRLEPATGELIAVAVAGEDGPEFRAGMVFPPGAGAAGLALQTRGPVAIGDILADARITLPAPVRARIERGPYRAVLAVPLMAQGRVVGVLSVRDQAGRRFASEEVALVQAFADHAAVALDNARLYAEATRRRRQAEELARLAQVVTASLDLPEVLERVARAATDLLPDSASRIWVAEGDRLVLRAESGVHSPPRSGLKTVLALGEGLTGHVALTRRPLVVEDVIADPRAVNAAWMRAEGYASLLSVPLLVRDRLVGVLSLLTRHRHRFDAEELDSLASFGTQAAIAIDNARLLEDSRTRQGRLETLLEITCELSRIQSLDSLLERIAGACGRLLSAEAVALRLAEGEELVTAADWGDGDEAFPTRRLRLGESLSGRVAVSGQPLLVQDPASDPRAIGAHRDAWRRLGYRAFLGVPARAGERVIGVLAVLTRRAAGFSPEDVAIATAFASQAAVALENARLLHETQRAYVDLSQTQAQLAHAQKMEAVGRLAGGIAHDFNNLLTVILGRTDLLLRTLKPGDPLFRGIELVRSTAGRAADLTRRLLAFSRKQVLQPAVLDLNAVIKGLEPMLGRLIGEDISLLTRLDPELGPVRADPGQLEQVIMNLAVNARDAMPAGGRLTLQTANVEIDAAFARRHVGARPGPHVMLAVSDTGTGMTPEVQAHLFEPFFTTKETGKGTGLGLATVYGIVSQSGGCIAVETAPGRGTTFHIYLPRAEERAAAPSVGAAPDPAPRGTETILLVEDEEGVRELARDILRAHGYTVLEARHGGEALLTCERHPGPIALLLSDAVMPQMSGRELAARLAPLRPEMKVLYISGYTDDATVRHGVLDSSVALLQKPFTPDMLLRKVRDILDAPGRPSAGSPAPGAPDKAGVRDRTP
jgi:GAF domain-containing protein/CheY-like chemotaxis protein